METRFKRVREDKAEITKELGNLLRMTRQFQDLQECKYIEDDYGNEWVILEGTPNEHGCSWTYRVNVNYDSGIALISDVLRQIH